MHADVSAENRAGITWIQCGAVSAWVGKSPAGSFRDWCVGGLPRNPGAKIARFWNRRQAIGYACRRVEELAKRGYVSR